MEQPAPHTVASLAADLRTLGVEAGDVVLLHSSLRSIGFVAGGTHAVVQALLDVLGPTGTLVVPTHTPDNSDPASWCRPPVPSSWWPMIREHAPGFDVARTPSRGMGVVAEAVRTWPGAVRSDHPQTSFAAVGRQADDVVGAHRLDDALGDESPLGALYRLAGKVLLVGCGHDSNTSLHLAEWRSDASPRAETGASVLRGDGRHHWVTWTDVVPDTSDFVRLGADFEATGRVAAGTVGSATARLMGLPAAVDFATGWMTSHRSEATVA